MGGWVAMRMFGVVDRLCLSVKDKRNVSDPPPSFPRGQDIMWPMYDGETVDIFRCTRRSVSQPHAAFLPAAVPIISCKTPPTVTNE